MMKIMMALIRSFFANMAQRAFRPPPQEERPKDLVIKPLPPKPRKPALKIIIVSGKPPIIIDQSSELSDFLKKHMKPVRGVENEK